MDTFSQSLSELGFGPEFVKQSERMGLRSLEDIAKISKEDLVAREGFSYHWLAELSSYLNKKGLLSLLQSLPGNTLR